MKSQVTLPNGKIASQNPATKLVVKTIQLLFEMETSFVFASDLSTSGSQVSRVQNNNSGWPLS